MSATEKKTCYGYMSYHYDKTECDKCKFNRECVVESLTRDANR